MSYAVFYCLIFYLVFPFRLDLSKNPICIMQHYREECIRCIPNLRLFDTEFVTETERVMLTVNANTCFHLAPNENRLLLSFLELINRPKIGNYIVPYDQPPPRIVLIVGPPASKRKTIVSKFVDKYPR